MIATSGTPPAPLDPDASPGLVLVVEDQDEVRMLLLRMLDMMGCKTGEASSGAEALVALETHPYDLILLDLTLPDMNGMVLFDVIRAQPALRHTPVVFLTGENAAPVRLKAFEQGAADYITKPFSMAELQARLSGHLRQKREGDIEREEAAAKELAARRALVVAQRRFSALVENSFDLICELTPNLLVDYASPNHRDVVGISVEEMLGEPWLTHIHPDDRLTVADTLGQMMTSPSPVRLTTRFRDHSNAWRYLDVSGSRLDAREEQARRLLVVSRDITSSKTAEIQLRRMAMEDPLTEISNRQHFSIELENLLNMPRSSRGESLMCIDLDDFKVINDTRGHPAGDLALKAVAQDLRRICRGQDLVARVGGDEFCVLMRDIEPETAIERAEQIVEGFRSRVLTLNGEQFRISVSLGLANLEPGVMASEAILRADTALYAAKGEGKGRVRLWSRESEDLNTLRSSAAWCERIKDGIDTQHFVLFYQPIVDLKTRTTVKYEALVRYREEDGTIIPPAVFLPAAGRYKLMPALDRAIFRLMLADLTTHPDLQVAVNLAGSTFIEEKFAAWLEETMTMAGVAPGRITLEITETEFMHDLGKARLAAERYHQLGFLLSLDDFGVGFSSMNYLRQLPVDFVKIDGSFVSRIQEDPVDLALLRSIKEIARLLGKQTVAEYVNRDDLAEFLAKEGVDFGQGYGLGKPAPLEIVLG